MSSPSAFNAIKGRLDGAWDATPVFYENEFRELSGDPDAFVFVEIFGGTFTQETMGAPQNNLWEETGLAYLHVMVPAGAGTATARQHAHDLQQLFREQDIDGLLITEMSVGAGEPGKEFPNYWAMTLTLFWQRYDITALP